MKPKSLSDIIDLIKESKPIRTCFGTLPYSTGQPSPSGEVLLGIQEECNLYKSIQKEKGTDYKR